MAPAASEGARDAATHPQARAHEADLAIGTVVAGRFEIRRVIGAGSMSTVYAAEHRGVGRPVAIKVLRRGLADDPDLVRRFRAEARDAAAVGHPNIVEVFDSGELPDGRPFLVMEHLAGRTLYEELLSRGRFPIARVCRLGRDIARALAAAHALGIVHRDPKAENVMIVRRAGVETVKVIDFGIAAHYAEGVVRPTLPGIVVGTPEYMAPELAADARPTPALDVYGLGVLLFEMATGGPPFRERDPRAMLLHKLRTLAPRLDERRTDAPPELTDLVMRCLATDPGARPATAVAVATRLDAILVALESPTATRTAIAAPLTATEPIASGGRTALVVAAATLLGLSAWILTEQETARPRAAIAAARPARADTPAPAIAVEPTVLAPVTIDDEPIESAPTVVPAPATAVAPTRAPARLSAADTAIPTELPKDELLAAAVPLSDDCVRERQRVLDARAAHDWDGMLRHIEATRCWFTDAEPAKLRVKALMELGRFDECVAVGDSLDDAEATRWVTLCARRLARP